MRGLTWIAAVQIPMFTRLMGLYPICHATELVVLVYLRMLPESCHLAQYVEEVNM